MRAHPSKTKASQMNPHIETFFGWLLRASWQAAALAILVLAAQVVFRKKLSARWRYALWLLVAARLALPVSPPSPVSIFNYARLDRLAGKTMARLAEPPRPLSAPNSSQPGRAAVPRSPELSQSPPPNPSEPGRAAVLRSPDPSHSVSPPKIAASPPPPPAPKPVSIYDNLNWPAIGAALWLAGVLFLTVRLARQNAVFLRQLRQAREVSDAETTALLEECRRLLRVSASVRLAETEHIRSPALYGLFAPRMLLPAGLSREFTRAELRHVFLHELAHLKRHDMPVDCVTGFLHLLNWFNPVLWFAFRRMAADRELACDELALSCAGEGEKRAYGETIIKLLEQCSRPAALPGLIGILEDKTQMRRRILMIARFKPVRRWSALAAAIVAVLGLVALTDAQVEKARAPENPGGQSKTWRVTGHVFDADTREPIPHFLIIPGTHTTSNGWPADWDAVNYVEGTNGSYVIELDKGTTNHVLKLVAAGYHWRRESPQLPASTICDISVHKCDANLGDLDRFEQDAFDLDWLLAPPRSEPIQKFVGARICAITAPDGNPAPLVTAYLLPRAPTPGATISLDDSGELRGGSIPHRMLRADLTGRFAVPVSDVDIASLVIAGPVGFKVVLGRELMEGNQVNRNIALEPWGRIKGMLRHGARATAGEVVGLEFLEGSGLPAAQFCLTNRAVADFRGQFEFDHVPPGKLRLALLDKAGSKLPEQPGPTLRITLAAGQTLETNFDLPAPGALHGTVLLPNGQPAAGAQVALEVSTYNWAMVSHAKLIWGWGAGIETATLPVEADEDGRIFFPPTADVVAIVAVHEQGYVRVGLKEFENRSKIALQPWGRIEGVLRLGTQPGTNELVLLFAAPALHGIPFDSQAYHDKTDRDGKFVFTDVPPGTWLISHGSEPPWDGDPVTVEAGKTNHVTIGGTGRPVIGRLLISAATNAYYDYYTAGLYSPGREIYARQQLKDGTGKWVMDGAFRVEDVPAGTWWFLAEFVRSGKIIATLGRTVVVPEMPGGRSDEALDLGTMETSLVHTPQVGEAAPLFEVQTTNFGTFKLADHRGQYVLLDFENIGDGLNTEPVRSVWASFGTNRRLAMLTVWLPQPGFVFVGRDDTEYLWPVARMRNAPWYERRALCGDYGLPINRNDPTETNLPWFMLVGPDGKIVGSDLHGDAIKAAVAAALEKK